MVIMSFDCVQQGEKCLAHLMELDANINLQAKDGRTPLHMTAINGRFTRAQMLLDRGALVDVGDKEGLHHFFRALLCLI